MNRKLIITESEGQRIRGLYNLPSNVVMKREYVFEAAFTTNEKYFIINDQVFDVFEKRDLGYLWESLDIFKEIFKNTNVDNDDYRTIQESFINLPLLEGKENLYEIRDILLEFDFMKDTWLGKEITKTGEGISDAVTSGLDGLKKFGVSVSKGEWSEILTLLGKGIMWTVRKLKEAAYSNLGMVVDAILVATGIGKGIQIAAWGLILALDVYQYTSGDWGGEPDPGSFGLLYILADIMGLAFAGGLAKTMFAALKPLKGMNTTQMSQYIIKTPVLGKLLKQAKSILSSIPSKLNKVKDLIKIKFPSGAGFITKTLSSIGNILKKIGGWISRILKNDTSNLTRQQMLKRGTAAGTIAGGISYGAEKVFGGDEVDMTHFADRLSTINFNDDDI